MRTTQCVFARVFARSLCAAAALLASVLAASCDNDYALYQTVAKEPKLSGTTVFQETTCTNVFAFNGNYYATTARLYSSVIHPYSTTSTSWSQVNVGGMSSYTLRSAVLVGSTIYALTGDNSSSVALYSSTDGSAWTSVTLPSYSGTLGSSQTFALDALYSAGGNLYAEAMLYGSANGAVGTPYYYLYYYTGSGWNVVSSFSSQPSTPIRGVVANSDTSPTTFWFASTGMLYSGSSATGSDASSVIGNFTSLSGKSIWAISYTGGHFYVSTTDGNLYQDSGSAEQVDSSSRPLMKVISVPYSSPSSIILVGTDTNNVNTAACGYYEGTFGSLDLGSSSQDVANSAVFATTVSAFPVLNFYYDSTNKNLFACVAPGTTSTSYYGLYENTWSGSSWTGWDAQ